MLELAEYLRDYRTLGAAEFEETHRASVLLVDKCEFDNEPGNVAFETVALTTRDDFGAQGYIAFPIVKNAHNPWPDRISIGRARNCDVVVRHASVSKLHAHFIFDGADLLFADAKSTNGCKVNDRRIEPGERVPLSCGDVLSIGLITATFYTPQGLFRFVREFDGLDAAPTHP